MIRSATRSLTECLERLVELHPQLCPRQVLGVRIGLQAAELLGVDLPNKADKRLLAFVETDGCFADGVSVASGCWLGRRTLRLMDYGKVAATCLDRQTGRAVRVWPSAKARTLAMQHAPDADSRWHAQLVAYQRMPTADLLRWREVSVDWSLELDRGYVVCAQCGEEVFNTHASYAAGRAVCRACAGRRYYA